MNPRKIIGGITFVGLLGAAFIFDLEALGTMERLAYGLALAMALFATFYDRKNIPKKTWDFSPKRGMEFFGIGLVAFPIMAVARSFGETELEWENVVVFTLIMATVAGIAGTFTEDIGI